MLHNVKRNYKWLKTTTFHFLIIIRKNYSCTDLRVEGEFNDEIIHNTL